MPQRRPTFNTSSPITTLPDKAAPLRTPQARENAAKAGRAVQNTRTAIVEWFKRTYPEEFENLHNQERAKQGLPPFKSEAEKLQEKKDYFLRQAEEYLRKAEALEPHAIQMSDNGIVQFNVGDEG